MNSTPFPNDDLPDIEHVKERIYDLFEAECGRIPEYGVDEFLPRLPEVLLDEKVDPNDHPGLIDEIRDELIRIKASLDAEAAKMRATVSAIKKPGNDSVRFELDEEGNQSVRLELDEEGKRAIPDELGPFQDITEIGSGEFGIVCSALDSRNDETVALKFPQSKVFANNRYLNMFLDEAKNVMKLEHVGIVKTHSIETIDGYLFIVQQLIEGGDLRASLYEQRTHQQIAELVARIADALAYAHGKRIVHRDLKPANILLDNEGRPLISDFGMALDENKQLGTPNSICGTIPYMAPEMVAGLASTMDGRADTWSLGVILYELLVHKRPFRGKSNPEIMAAIETNDPRPPRQIDLSIPKELQRICLKCLDRAKRNRYLTADELASDLRYWIDSTKQDGDKKDNDEKDGDDNPVFIPKGLRSYGPEDSDFFLDLLPGPRDRHNLPASIRFWKSRICEPVAEENRVPVGVIYGPSGSGKSSFVKAGLLPQVKKNVEVIYVESVQKSERKISKNSDTDQRVTTDSTEIRLTKKLKKKCPDIPDDLELPEIFRGLSQGRWRDSNKKVLIVLDQFEQRLSEEDDYERSQLARALRHCDGEHLQCLLLNRDDFHMALTRFADALEMDLLEGRNAQAIDLFDRAHAKKVLIKLGQAYGRLPDPFQTSDEETEPSDAELFLDQAVNELASGSYIVCVRLTLFAEMFKSRDWTTAELESLGGVKGVGKKYLEEVFESGSRRGRIQGIAARAVLEALLPESGTDIRGSMKSKRHLLDASNLQNRPEQFDKLINVLDNELRLITGTEQEAAEDELPPAASRESKVYYQLTHDYLVPSIRNWLIQKQDESPRLRTQSRFTRLAKLWNSNHDSRYLPTFVEFLQVVRYVPRNKLSQSERTYLNKATTRYLLRGVIVALLLLTFGFIRWRVIQQHESELATQYVARFIDAHPDAVEPIVTSMEQHRSIVVEELLSRRKSEIEPAKRLRLDIGLVLLDFKEEDVVESVVKASKNEFSFETQNIVMALQELSDSREGLTREYDALKKAKTNPDERARLAITMCFLGHHEVVSQWIAKETQDFKTLFVQSMPGFPGDFREVVNFLDENSLQMAEKRDDVAAIYCLAIGKLRKSGLIDPSSQQELIAQLKKRFNESKSSYLTASSEWALSNFGQTVGRREIDGQVSDVVSTKPEVESIWVDSLGFRMNRVPSQSVKLKARVGKEIHELNESIPRDFYVADREVTVGDFKRFISDESYNGPKPIGFKEIKGDEQQPMIGICYINAIMFCNWLSQKERLDSCYIKEQESYEVGETIELEAVVRGLNDKIPINRWTLDQERVGFSLPTFAEWKCFENGAGSSFLYFGSEKMKMYLDDYCWNASNSTDGFGRISAQRTKGKIPNSNGLYDVYGNAAEICWDFPFRGKDPNASIFGFYNVERGGSYQLKAEGFKPDYFWPKSAFSACQVVWIPSSFSSSKSNSMSHRQRLRQNSRLRQRVLLLIG